jgi:PPK2 family polyphosphate:nucleotide phosphotransferase
VRKSAPTAKPLRIDRFRVKPGQRVDLARWPTDVARFYASEDEAKVQLARQVARTSELQDVLYASDRHALLLVFQAMDAAGKDGAIKHVLSGVNPQGCHVSSFKQPSTEELDHDFLWRTAMRLPERGRIGIFNRSYYEEVLVVRVHPDLLARQRLPESLTGKDIWKQRFKSIRGFERHLARNGTIVLKFFLHISKEEQRERLLARLEEPAKRWKFNAGDIAERKLWGKYMAAYEDAIRETSTEDAPWYVVPADSKPFARLVVAHAIVERLSKLDLKYPTVGAASLKEMQKIKSALLEEEGAKSSRSKR